MQVNQLVIRGLVGSGGQARVYVGTCADALVAFKYFTKPAGVALEAALLLGFSNPRIIRARGISIDHELSGIILEYAAGSSLRLILNAMAERSLSPTPSAVAYVAHEIGRALRYLHPAQIIHNDLSPANILFISDGSLKLCDFGAATLMGNKSALGSAFGKRSYMALELLYAGRSSFASDRYAHAALLFELITGQRFKPAYPSASFALMAGLREALPDLFDWIALALAPLRSLRPGHDALPIFDDKLLLAGKEELRRLVELAPNIIESAGELEGRVIEFVRFSSVKRQ